MKLIHKIIIIVFLFPSFLGVKAQFGEQVIITDEVNGVRNIVLGDIDNDGLKDILYASQVDNNIGWIKNINNATNFRELNIIGFSNQTLHGSLADLDSDGDLDALAITVAQDKVYWFENTDGLGDFETRQTIAINFDGAFKVEGADINGDGFMDAVASAMNEQSIYWFENLNGTNTFGAKQVIANTNTVGRYFNLVDIDNDGDID